MRPLEMLAYCLLLLFFFFNDTATTEIYTLSLHDALPISKRAGTRRYDATLQEGAEGPLVTWRRGVGQRACHVRAFRHNHTPAAPNSRFGTQAANVGGSAPPWPTAFDSWNISRSTKVVARHTATPQAMPLRGVEIASGAPNSATMMQANGTDSLSACSTRSFLVSEPERASASTYRPSSA